MVDAGFIWTEPHSRRVKVKITVQKEVIGGTILQQVFVVEFVVNHQMCEDCHRREAKDTWTAVLQLRQKVKHKKTFLYLEQLIIKHRAQRDCVNISTHPDGVDFFFPSKTAARKMLDFFEGRAPIRCKMSERLISHDLQSATATYKYTYSIEIAPICRDDIVCLHPSLAKKLGTISPIVLCEHVGALMHFIDPLTLQRCDIAAPRYFNFPFQSICTHKMLTEYVVMDIEPITDARGQSVTDGKYSLSEATVARVRDLGNNDEQFTVRTHLGRILKPGDQVWGFDIKDANINDEHANRLNIHKRLDLILVKKSFSEKKRRRRKWKLKNITNPIEGNKKKEIEQAEQDYENFLQDLEEDPELRATVNIYKDPSYIPGSATVSEVDDDELRISLEEMLDEFDDLDMGQEDEEEDSSRHSGMEQSEAKRVRVSAVDGTEADDGPSTTIVTDE
jgi:nonsense-mediated mRNA decay protein 3